MLETEESALLRAVIADPESDTPRLLYADWLDQREDEAARAQAEFIRLQCRLACCQPELPSSEQLATKAKEIFEIFSQQWWPWLGAAVWPDLTCPTPDWRFVKNNGAPVYVVRRGFPDRLLFGQLEHLRAHGQGWLRAAPTLRHLELSPLVGSAAASPQPDVPAIPDDRQADLAESKSWDIFPQRVSLEFNCRSTRSLDNFLRDRSLPSWVTIRGLSLTGELRPDRVWESLAAAPELRHLQQLTMTYLHPAWPVLPIFFSRPRWPELEKLRIVDSGLGREGCLALAQWPTAKRLRTLEISQTSPGRRGLEALANSPVMEGLQELRLSMNNFGDKEVLRLTQVPTLDGLEVLDFSRQQVETAGAVAVAYCRAFRRLRVLRLSHNPISDVGALALYNSPYLADDCVIDLRKTKISAMSVRRKLRNRFGERVLLDDCPKPIHART